MNKKEFLKIHVPIFYIIVEIIPIQTNKARRFLANSIGIS
jgi:hypothetical protein